MDCSAPTPKLVLSEHSRRPRQCPSAPCASLPPSSLLWLPSSRVCRRSARLRLVVHLYRGRDRESSVLPRMDLLLFHEGRGQVKNDSVGQSVPFLHSLTSKTVPCLVPTAIVFPRRTSTTLRLASRESGNVVYPVSLSKFMMVDIVDMLS